jgi:hypothetical protein
LFDNIATARLPLIARSFFDSPAVINESRAPRRRVRRFNNHGGAPLAHHADHTLNPVEIARVRHHAITFSAIADTGRFLPPLSSTPSDHHAKIGCAACELLAVERDFTRANPST